MVLLVCFHYSVNNSLSLTLVTAQKALRRAYVESSSSFLAERMPDATLLKQNYVSKSYIENVEYQATKSLQQTGFADFADLGDKLTSEEQSIVRDDYKNRHPQKLLLYADRLIIEELFKKLADLSLSYASTEAKNTLAAGPENGTPLVKAGITVQGVCRIPMQTALHSDGANTFKVELPSAAR
jgi:hypothetical protein